MIEKVVEYHATLRLNLIGLNLTAAICMMIVLASPWAFLMIMLLVGWYNMEIDDIQKCKDTFDTIEGMQNEGV